MPRHRALTRPRAPAGWRRIRGGRAIRRDYVLTGFAAAVAFVNRIAALADAADHHPDLHLTRYRRLAVVLTTHDAGGVTRRDLELSAAIDAAPKDLAR